jgi:hypothetical protein
MRFSAATSHNRKQDLLYVVLHGIHVDVSTIASCDTGADLTRVKSDYLLHGFVSKVYVNLWGVGQQILTLSPTIENFTTNNLYMKGPVLKTLIIN